MQLDPVRSDTRLPVQEVEERDPDHTGARVQTLATLRAAIIWFRRVTVAPFVQSGEGVSAIIVREPVRRTRWWSRSASVRSRVTLAMTE
jgi:hypothetical protein